MSAATTSRSKVPKPAVLPAALRAGDVVRLISPASWFDPDKATTGMNSLRALGLQPQLGANALAHYGQYSAGTSAQRLEDLHAAFADDSVKAIICNRGGYGSVEMSRGLDLDLIGRNPKTFVGCSDWWYFMDRWRLEISRDPTASIPSAGRLRSHRTVLGS